MRLPLTNTLRIPPHDAVAWPFSISGRSRDTMSQAVRSGFVLSARDLSIGVGLMVAMGVLAGVTPAIGAMRLKITDALRRN